jgi:ketosteroid isomerase-like protein
MLEETYRRGVEAFNRRDLAGWLSLMDEEIEVESRFSRVGATFYRGHDQIEQWWADLAEAWDYLEVEPDVVRQVRPDQTLALIHLRAKGLESGVEVREPHAHRVDFRAGKWLRLSYEDRALAERELRGSD